MQRFLQGRVELAKALVDMPQTSYADVVLILTAVMSACASRRWPGRKIDRARFVELLVRHSDEDFHASWVSVPSLLNVGLIDEPQTAYETAGSARIFRDDEIDLPFGQATRRFPAVGERRLRCHSYASLIYGWLRCGYAHEYCADESVSQMPAVREPARISYIGRLKDGEFDRRMVSFHIEYLIRIAQHHVDSLAERPESAPGKWWIQSG